MKVVTEILQDLEILKRLLKHNANLKIRINYYLTHATTQMDMHIYLVELEPFTQMMTSKLWCKCRTSTKVLREETLELTNCTLDH